MKRTRFNYTEEQYQNQGIPDYRNFPDHIFRINISTRMIHSYIQYLNRNIKTIIDLAAGCGEITKQLGGIVEEIIVSDINKEKVALMRDFYSFQSKEDVRVLDQGDAIERMKDIDVYTNFKWSDRLIILSEFLEHIPAPEDVLGYACNAGQHLFLSTPYCEPKDINPNHLWTWDDEDIKQLMFESGYRKISIKSIVDLPITNTKFQLWIVSA